MSKPLILLIYQDCYDCGSSKAWHEKIQESAADLGVLIKYTPHNTPGAKELILEAHKKGVNVPFVSDGKRHSRKLEDLVEVTMQKSAPKKRQKQEVKDGAIPETE